MNHNGFAAILAAVIMSAACETLPESPSVSGGGVVEEGIPVSVSVNLGTSPFSMDTRASDSHTYEVENLIYDIWVIQFNNRGQRIGSEYFPREGLAGQFIENFEVGLVTAMGYTVCLVVNTEDASLHWPDNLPDFQETMFDVKANNELDRTRIPMCGYWKGDVSGNMQELTVLLSRMMARINLVVNNGTGETLGDLEVELGNVPTMAYVYPMVDHEILPETAYLEGSFADVLPEGLADGASETFYHYIAPNICGSEEFATTVKITSGDREWNVTLGTNSPDTAERIYTLYANNYYTFTLNLKAE